ncbi:muscarinic acetylcholine receptor DM1 isoform X1 [Neodiprion virginianus]|uniref:muscarinic acetylcholine receptor DM1 isoform X1 n=2 Tax=Neodiprion virginianus TaxID=2961670 RepID=UPI001EE6E969|nr:muscarinic acetylcholine receptor DM1 isoform X1 [Neodiprion virginianus]
MSLRNGDPPSLRKRAVAERRNVRSDDMNVTTTESLHRHSNESLNSTFETALEGVDPNVGLTTRYTIFEIVLITIVAVCLSLATVIGNSMVMISFKIDKRLQTISNYFLFSLAVADLAIGLISMPLFTVSTLLGYWPLGPHICDTWLALDYLASNASVLNLLIISFDRYFSVTRPLTYRAKRTTFRAGIMIACAWGISILLWPPWIYAWPYIEGERTVPDNACYIQFIETNHYITFGTAIAAFYVPVSVMCFLYWRIWRETEKRKKDLPNLQAGKKDASKRSNSRYMHSDEALDLDEWKRQRSESNVGADEINTTYITSSCIDGRYSEYKIKHRPFSWIWLKSWCIAWWHSGREDDDDDDEVGGPESSRTGHGWEETLTPISAETPLPSNMSRCPSLSVIQSTGISIGRNNSPACTICPSYGGVTEKGRLTTKSTSNDSVYTILIRLPTADGNGQAYGSDVPSIKMYSDDMVGLRINHAVENFDENYKFSLRGHGECHGFTGPAAPALRRPSHISEMRTPPLNDKIVPKQVTGGGGSGGSGGGGGGSGSGVGGRGLLNKTPNKKKKKPQEKKADTKAAKTLSAILLAFIITWTPYNILVLLKPLTACVGCIPQELWDFFYYLCYINSTINPVCYALCNASFRRTYVRILTCKWHSRDRTAVNRGYYN